jgi:transcriptional regulator with XRE-family HTH domain
MNTMHEDRPIRRWRGGSLLTHYRQHLGELTQQQLANRISCSRSMIAQIEAGTRLPSPHLLLALSQAFSLSSEKQAMLFVAFEHVPPPGPMQTLEAIVAVLHLDPTLSEGQAKQLSALISGWYQAAVSREL